VRNVRQERTHASQTLAVAPLAASRIPLSEAAYPIISGILDLVPASRWAFARAGSHSELAVVYDSHGDSKALGAITDELKRQRKKVATGPRIAAPLRQFGDFTSGVTLIFANAQETFGILRLLRTPDFGSFTSTEITVLTLALHAASDRLAGLRPAIAKADHSDV
jgi:hypothetical protein